jgi:hypothetical protein
MPATPPGIKREWYECMCIFGLGLEILTRPYFTKKFVSRQE